MIEKIKVAEKVKDNDGMGPIYGIMFLGLLVLLTPFVLNALNIH